MAITSGGGGYFYKFANGTMACTPQWSNEFYLLMQSGKSPPRPIPDLSRVIPGTAEYFTWLCRAQGAGEEAHAVRMGFDKAKLKWQATTDTSMRTLSPSYSDPSRPKPVVPPQWVDDCASYVSSQTLKKGSDEQGGNPMAWTANAYQYTTDVLPQRISESLPGGSHDHRSGGGGGGGGGAPPGRDQYQPTTPNAGQSAGGFLGIPTVYLAAGGVGVVLVAALLLKKKGK
jgi:hypothetical protein